MEVFALLLVFLGSFVIALFLTRWVRDLAIRHELLDHPDLYRKVHEVPTPRFGGVAMVLSTLVGLAAYLLFVVIFDLQTNLPDAYVMMGGACIVLTGVLDDFIHLGVRQKLIGQFVSILVVVLSDVSHRIYLPEFQFFGISHHVFSIILTTLWMLGIINAMNLIDGLDGLAAGISVIAIVSFTAVYASQQVIPNAVVGMVLIGALLGFLVYNFRPASIFMGDTGSLSIGFFLAVYAIPSFNAPFYFSRMAVPDAWVPALLILGLPILDTLSSIVRRIILGRSVFLPDQDHIHHRLIKVWGISHVAAVLLLYLMASILGVSAWIYANVGTLGKAVTLLTMFIMIFVFLMKLKMFRVPTDIWVHGRLQATNIDAEEA